MAIPGQEGEHTFGIHEVKPVAFAVLSQRFQEVHDEIENIHQTATTIEKVNMLITQQRKDYARQSADTADVYWIQEQAEKDAATGFAKTVKAIRLVRGNSKMSQYEI